MVEYHDLLNIVRSYTKEYKKFSQTSEVVVRLMCDVSMFEPLTLKECLRIFRSVSCEQMRMLALCSIAKAGKIQTPEEKRYVATLARKYGLTFNLKNVEDSDKTPSGVFLTLNILFW